MSLVVAAALVAAARLPRTARVGVVGALAATGFAVAAGNLLRSVLSPERWFTPFGWVDLVGNLALLVLAVRWRRGTDEPELA